MPETIPASFAEVFSREPDVEAWVPDCISLIGGHTDYNDGYVLAIAIPHRTIVRAGLRGDRWVHVWNASAADARPVSYELGTETRHGGWTDHVQGVSSALRSAGFELQGMDLFIEPGIPPAAGLWPSASLGVALVRAMATLLNRELEPVAAGRVAHAAEAGLVEEPAGVADHIAAALATPDAALFLDTRSLTHEHIPMPSNVELLVVDSGGRRERAADECSIRRTECADAARRLGVPALRDADARMLRSIALPSPLDRRARHVVTENERVVEMRAALLDANVPAAGALMNASHRSMRDDLEASTPEVDRLVELAQAADGVSGARLTGSGFGGCIVGLVARGRAADVGRDLIRQSGEQTGHQPSVLVPRIHQNVAG